MELIYVGCKPAMNAERMSFLRGKKREVTEEVGNKLLKIDGFVTSMTKEAKEELKFNTEREKTEKEKLASGVKVVTVTDNSKLDDEIESLKEQLAEATNGSQLESLMKEVDELKEQLVEGEKVIQEFVTQNKNLTKEVGDVVKLNKKLVKDLADSNAKVQALELTQASITKGK